MAIIRNPVIFLLIAVFITLLSGCAGALVEPSSPAQIVTEPGNEPISGMHERGTFEGLSVETELRILQDYMNT